MKRIKQRKEIRFASKNSKWAVQIVISDSIQTYYYATKAAAKESIRLLTIKNVGVPVHLFKLSSNFIESWKA